jgi:hypothetical protein
MSNPFKNNLKANLRTLLTATGMLLLSFGVGSDEFWMLFIGFIFPTISAIWSWVDGNFANVESWAKKTIQTLPPLLVYLGMIDSIQAGAINTVLLVLLTIFIPPSE